MKHLLLLLAFAFASSIHAGEPDYRAFFSHPDAQVVIQIGTAHSDTVPWKNHSIPKAPRETPGFFGGFGTSGDHPIAFKVQWKFIQKTEYGDLYLFAVERDKALVKAFPALYTGSTVVAYEHDDIRVTVEPVSKDKDEQ